MQSRLVVAIGILFVVCGSTRAAETYWRVMGASTKEPSRIRPWSGPCASQLEANAEMQILIRQHAKGGTLEFSEDKPINLSVQEFSGDGKVTDPKGDKEEPSLTSNNPSGAFKTPEMKIIDPGKAIYSEKSPSLKGKSYYGTINGDRVNLAFGDGTVEFAGDRAGPAKYSVLISTISIQSERTKYMGAIDGDKITGTFERLDGSEKGNWSMQLADSRLVRVAGTYLSGSKGDLRGGYTIVVINLDGTGSYTHRSSRDSNQHECRWIVGNDGLLTDSAASTKYKHFGDRITMVDSDGEPLTSDAIFTFRKQN